MVLFDCIDTLHLSFYNGPIDIHLSALRNVTLVKSNNCLNHFSKFPATIRILLFHNYPNYMLPNWPVVLHSLLNLRQLSSLRIFMYDLIKTVDDYSCQLISKVAPSFSDFGFCFRYRYGWPDDDIDTMFKDHRKFIRQLCDRILRLSLHKQPYYSIEDEGCGLTMWF